jgi:Arc/MetJ-type ribon-helix-helix transcriptional regulator
MQVELSPEQSSLIELGIQEGRFRDPKEAIEQALAPWVRREQARLELLAEIAVGDQSPREEDTTLDSEEDVAKFFAGVEQRGLARLTRAKSPGV